MLDTQLVIHWISDSVPLLPEHRAIIESASAEEPLWVSDISLWEIATLESLGRIELDLPLRDWLERATAPPLVRRAHITPRWPPRWPYYPIVSTGIQVTASSWLPQELSGRHC